MANYYPITSRFTGGQISPRLFGQVDTKRYQESLEDMTNFLCLPQGPAMRRQGFAYVDPALNTTDVRLLPFKVPGSEDYTVELGPGYISILTRGKGRETFTTDELLLNGDFARGLEAWTTTPGAISATTGIKVVRDLKIANCTSYEPLLTNGVMQTLEQNISVGAVTDIELDYTWSAYRRVFIGGVTDATSVTVSLGTISGATDLYTATHTFDPAGRIQAYTVRGEPTTIPPDLGTGSLANLLSTVDESVSVNVGAATNVFLSIVFSVIEPLDSIESGYTFTVCSISSLSTATDGTVSQTLATPWLEESDLGLIQYVSESGGGRMYFAHPSYPPYFLSFINGSWIFAIMALTGTPVSWTGSNWPSVIEFFQGRLWLAATPSDQSTIWASMSANPFDFTPGVNDDDGMELPLNTTGGIKWLKGQKSMIVGTDIGEQTISSQGSIITPTDRKAEKHSSWGSVDIQPSFAGNDIVYVSQDRTMVRAINSLEANRSFTSIDLTWVSQNITHGRIIETTYIQNPNYQLWCLLADGTIVICTYDREHEVVAWQQVITDGSFLSLTKIESVQGTSMWAAVRRNGAINIEVIDPDESEWQFTDSWISRPVVVVDNSPDPDYAVIGGLTHLIGLTVQVIVDGAVEPDKVVSDTGFITIENLAGNRAVVGLGYNASMTTLQLAGGNPAGTGMGSKRRYTRVFVQLYDSALPKINGVRPPERSSEVPMNTVEPNTSGEVDVRTLGRDNGGRVTIEQDLPKKCMITGIYGKASEEQT